MSTAGACSAPCGRNRQSLVIAAMAVVVDSATTSAATPAARIREIFECRSLPNGIALSPAALRCAANSRPGLPITMGI